MEKPLNQRVAEALEVQPRVTWHVLNAAGTGSAIGFDGEGEAREYLAEHHAKGRMKNYHVGPWYWYPLYDTDWSATGPLIERLSIELTPPGPPDGEDEWGATTWDPPFNDRGPTPLLAVCNLILKLDQAGKLPSSRNSKGVSE